MTDSVVLENNFYDDVSDGKLANVDSGVLRDAPTYANVAASRTFDDVPGDENAENDGANGGQNDDTNGDTNTGSRYIPAHNGKFLPNFEREHFHPMNVTPDRPNTAFFRVDKEVTSKDIFDSLKNDDIPATAVKCLQREPSGEVMITFSDIDICLKFIERSTQIVRRGGARFSAHPDAGKLVYLTVYDAPYELPDSAIIKRLAPYCRVYSCRLGKFQNFSDVYNCIRHYWVLLEKFVPCYLRFGRFQGRFYHNDQVKTCHKCGESSYVARDCKNQGCFNCDGTGHTSKNCPEKIKCCNCKSEAQMAVDCQHSWYRRPVLNRDAPAYQHEGQQAQQAASAEHADHDSAARFEETPAGSADVPPEAPPESAGASMDLDSSLSGVSARFEESPEMLLNSQGLLVYQEGPVDLPSRPATVYPSMPLVSLSEDLQMSDDEGDHDDDVRNGDIEFEETEESTPASTSSSSSGFVFPDSLPLAAVAKKFKAVRVKASRRAPAKLFASSQPSVRKATHSSVLANRKSTQHLAARRSDTSPPMASDMENTEHDPGKSNPSQPS